MVKCIIKLKIRKNNIIKAIINKKIITKKN